MNIKKEIVILTFLVLFVALFSVVVSSAKIDNEVEETLELEEVVRVIVILKEDTKLKSFSTDSMKEKIKVKQELVLSTLNTETDLKLRHKYDNVNAFSGELTKKGLGKLKNNPYVESIFIDEPFKVSLDDTIPQVNADDVWQIQSNGINLTGAGETICIIDTGIDYTHPDLGGCSITWVNTTGTNESYVLESAHPYANSVDYIWNITKTGYDSVALHFKNISLEYQGEVGGDDTNDRITIYDYNWVEIAQYHGINGNITDLWTPHSEGDTIHVRLETDPSVTHYGFYIDYALNGTTNTTYNWSECSKVIGGWDYVNNDADPMDDYGHGTHVAGIAAGENNTYMGVAPGAKLTAVKSLDNNGDGWSSDILAGIDWCINNSERYNISVISMSLGGDTKYTSYCNSNVFASSVNLAVSKNIIVTAASGNSGWTDGIDIPACIENVTPVGAVSKSDTMATYTSRGNILDILAPGGMAGDCINGVCSTCLGGGFCGKSGTSMATPHVSGAAVLMKQFVKLNNGTDISPQLIEDTLNNTGVLVYDSGSNKNYSRIDIYSAIISLDSIGPKWSANETGQMSSSEVSPLNNSVYSKGQEYQFNVTWTDPFGIDTALIEHNFTGTFSNHSMDNISDEYYYNYSDLAAGTYAWRSYANDTNGNWNQTDQESYIVQKAASSVSLLLNGTSENKTVELNTIINITSEISAGEANITLYENGTLMATNNTNFTIIKNYNVGGEFNLTLVYDETQNYSASQETFFVIIDTQPPVINVTGPLNNSEVLYSYNVNLNFTTDETANCSYSFDDGSFASLGLGTSFGVNLDDGDQVLANAVHNATINCTDEYNHTSSAWINFTVNDTTAPVVTSSLPTGTTSDNTPALKIYTNEPAICRFDTSDTIYDSMDDPFDTTDDTYSRHTLDTLSNGDYDYYAKCKDRQDNKMSTSEHIDFTVDASSTTSSSGGSSSCSDECDNGQISCSNFNTIRFCDFNVQNGCWEWSFISCAGVCENGGCVATMCTEDWICGPWERCIDGKQERECGDLSECGTTERIPLLEQDCEESAAVGEEKLGTEEAFAITEMPIDLSANALGINKTAFSEKFKQASPVIILFVLVGLFAGVFVLIAKYGGKIPEIKKPSFLNNLKPKDKTVKELEKVTKELDKLLKK